MHYRVLLGLLLCLPGLLWASQCSLLIVGDSLSSGYGLAANEGWVDQLGMRLKKTAPAWQVVNASVSGSNIKPPALPEVHDSIKGPAQSLRPQTRLLCSVC